MAYKNPFLSVEMSGTLALGQEIWTCGFHLADPASTATPAQILTAFTGRETNIALFVGNFIANNSAIVPADVKLTEVKLSARGTDGKVVGEPLIAAVARQGAHTGGYAPQNALVVTLVSDKGRAPGRYNRFYVPISASGLGDGPFLNEDQQESYANAVVTMIDAVNSEAAVAMGDDNFRVAAVSNSGTGFAFPVTKVSIGKIVDTQQRRRNKLTESPYSTPVPAAA